MNTGNIEVSFFPSEYDLFEYAIKSNINFSRSVSLWHGRSRLQDLHIGIYDQPL